MEAFVIYQVCEPCDNSANWEFVNGLYLIYCFQRIPCMLTSKPWDFDLPSKVEIGPGSALPTSWELDDVSLLSSPICGKSDHVNRWFSFSATPFLSARFRIVGLSLSSLSAFDNSLLYFKFLVPEGRMDVTRGTTVKPVKKYLNPTLLFSNPSASFRKLT